MDPDSAVDPVHWGRPDPHSTRTVRRYEQADGNPQSHPHLLAHAFQMTKFTWEYLGFREYFVHPGAQKTPRNLNTPEHGHRRTLVRHGSHRDLRRAEK